MPDKQRQRARTITVLGNAISGRDRILLGGGLFLLWKSVREINGALEGEQHVLAGRAPGSFAVVVGEIAVLDIVFCLDSVITAVGLVGEIAYSHGCSFQRVRRMSAVENHDGCGRGD